MLDDAPLLDETKRLAADERRATAALLRALIEIDRRRLYLGLGCSSMFTYCTQVLHLAEGAAYNRIEAARAAARFPVILALLEQSSVTLTAVRLLAPHLTDENNRSVLDLARHRTRRDVEELVASIKSKPDVPAVVRKLPVRTNPASQVDSPSTPLASASAPQPLPVLSGNSPGPLGAAHDVIGQPPAKAAVQPLAPERYRIQVTVSGATHDKFRRAQALLRHAVPSGDAAEIVDRALTLLVEDLERKRLALTSQPRRGRQADDRSRHMPAAVRRAVWRRDGGRCAFAGSDGRCRETAWLEFHHVQPYACGGAATVENIQLRCRAHNAYEARLVFGESGVSEASMA